MFFFFLFKLHYNYDMINLYYRTHILKQWIRLSHCDYYYYIAWCRKLTLMTHRKLFLLIIIMFVVLLYLLYMKNQRNTFFYFIIYQTSLVENCTNVWYPRSEVPFHSHGILDNWILRITAPFHSHAQWRTDFLVISERSQRNFGFWKIVYGK